jgi:LytR cell envelope-related transcriptional attenuator
LRGGLLIAFAVVLGLGLLAKSFDDGGPLGTSSGASTGTGQATTSTATKGTTSTTAAPASHNPGEVKVKVLNGTGKAGLAKTGADQLKASGFAALDPGNTKATVAASAVYFATGFQADATVIGKSFSVPDTAVQPIPSPVPAELGDLGDAVVVVVLGPDAPLAGGTATPTTAAPSN